MAIKDMTFSNGVIKSLEKELLNRAALSRIIDEPSYSSALKSVKEQGFGRNVQTDDVDILEEVETEALDDFVREFSPSKEYSAFCLKKIDYFNAEKYLRSKHIRGYGYEEKRTGLIENIAEKIDKKDKELPKELLSAYEKCEESFKNGTATGVEISTEFLRAYYSDVLKVVKNKTLKGFLKREIDCKNLSAALRSGNVEEAKKQFISGGELAESEIAFIAEAETETILKRFAFTEFSDIIKTATGEKAEGKPLSAFEAYADGYALAEMKKIKYETEGATPFTLYYLYKKAEIGNVKLILKCKKANLSPELIRRRLRTAYDG